MSRRRRILTCEDCGTPEKVNRRSKLCIPCAIERVQESHRQLRDKKGPIYDRWLTGLETYVKRMDEIDGATQAG